MNDGKKFEEALAELEGIVAKLEQTDVPLETSLALFEQGMSLTRLLEQRLDEAERKIEMLVKGQDGRAQAVPFGEEPDGRDDDDTPF
ncbi:MAG: exodeoxyribonuclease VII small subunit [Acidobacteriota bacterium]